MSIHVRFKENFPLPNVIECFGLRVSQALGEKIFLPTHPTLFWGGVGAS